MKMEKKKILLIILSITAVLSICYAYSNRPIDSVLQDAQIIEVGENSLVLEGNLRSLDGKTVQKKTTTFNVSPSTRLIKNATVITEAQLKSGAEFMPTVETMDGNFSDFKVGSTVIYAKAGKNLFTRKAADALEIKYAIYELPKLSK